MTDLFRFVGLDADEARWNAFVSGYFQRLPQALSELDGAVLPGIRELLELLAARPDVSLGLLTGNFEEGAWLKLRHFEIDVVAVERLHTEVAPENERYLVTKRDRLGHDLPAVVRAKPESA